jgi:uncharacterized protein YbbC (DUF1343 family)
MKLNRLKVKSTFFLILITFNHLSFSQDNMPISVGANQLNEYLTEIINLDVGVIANSTSRIINNKKSIHLIDSLLKLNINVKKVFSPEHGFRGEADAGEKIKNSIDLKTGLEIISLYGSNRKPTDEQLKDLDILVFDIQDVGARFYTYISTLHYVMEAAAENNLKLIILDRPNPNAHYVDGPVLNMEFKSFIGMHPVPIVHGLTIGEYAMMINNEGWLENGVKCNIKVVPVNNYKRSVIYNLPIKPSPNLPNKKSINLYPSLCLFERTSVSVGRGTNLQFQIIGTPYWTNKKFSFTPKSMPGAKYPKHINKKCFGENLSETPPLSEINLSWIIKAYNDSSNKKMFFKKGFNKLAGNQKLQEQITNGISEKDIKLSWQKNLNNFKKIRSIYLIYD